MAMSGKTARKNIPYPKTTDPDTLAANHQATSELIDNINEGHQDFLQAGVVASTDWSFTANINGSTGALGSTANTGGTAWLPDPVVSGGLMRSVSALATLSGLAPLLPTPGKYVAVAYELTPSIWGGAATVSVHTGLERNTQAEAESGPALPSQAVGKTQVRHVIILNNSGKYEIKNQLDLRKWATGGGIIESEAQGRVGTEAITDPKIIKGRALLGTEGSYVAQVEHTANPGGFEFEPSATRPAFVTVEVPTGAVEIIVGGVSVGNVSGVGSLGVPVNPKQKFKVTAATSVKFFLSYLVQ